MSCIQWEMPQISVIFYRTTPAACEGMCRAIWKIKETSPNCVYIFGRAYFNHVCTYVPGDKTRATFHKYRAHYLPFFLFLLFAYRNDTISSQLKPNPREPIACCTLYNSKLFISRRALFFCMQFHGAEHILSVREKKTHTKTNMENVTHC